jgi:cytochrome c oxidase subunit 2
MTPKVRSKLKLAAGVALATVLLAACADDLPQSGLNPAGPVAQKQFGLYQMVFWIAVAVFILVEGLLIWFTYRYRAKRGHNPSQIHGNNRLEIGWTIAPALVLAMIAVPTVAGIWELAKKPVGEDVVHVDVVGHQWWWEFRYYDDPNLKEPAFVTANEMVIPVNQPVSLRLCAAGSTGPADPKTAKPDGEVGPQASGPATGEPCKSADSLGNSVIHAFWVPRLAGKQDVVPGRTNMMSIEADQPGVFPGQCAEFCSWSHANMRFQVRAMTSTDYDAWLTAQRAAAVAPTDPSAMAGLDTFTKGQCIACHAINGVEGAQVELAPNLTHFASRPCFAGCMFRTYTADGQFDEEAMRKWLENPPAMKPGSWMPNYHLSPEEIDGLIAYLETLK